MKSGKEEDKKIASSYRSREFYIVRGIERGKEHEGVKFWRFNKVSDGSGIMDKLIPLMKRLDDKKPGGGAIWRPDAEGRDIVISTVRDTSKSKEGYTKVSQIMVEDPSVLSADEAQANTWLSDPTTWKDIYKKKPIEFLHIVAEGSEPVWDKEAKKFVAKSDEHTSAPAMEPSKKVYNKPTETEDQIEEPISLEVDDLPF
jgi:hypothetical protein